MTDSQWLDELRELLQELHTEAVAAHIELEVLTGTKDQVFLLEFEHAFSHVVKEILQSGSPTERPHIQSHLRRIVLEAREYVAEEYLAAIRNRLDPYRKHPRLAKLMLVDKPQRLEEFYGRVGTIQSLIISGRQQKGHDGSYEKARDAFRQASQLAAELDADVPPSRFRDRLFSIILSGASLILGFLLRGLFGS